MRSKVGLGFGARLWGLAIACKLAILFLPNAAVGQVSRDGYQDPATSIRRSPAKLSIWTDRIGYATLRNTIHAYLSMQAMDDVQRYSQTVFLEDTATGDRQYWKGWKSGHVTGFGPLVPSNRGTRIKDMKPSLIWTGRLAQEGTWRLVAELRSSDRTVPVKRVAATFVVTKKIPLVLGESGERTEILESTTWEADRIHVLRGPVYVRAGATLNLEAGTLVLARGAAAVIVVERGGRIIAKGRPKQPVILTCDAEVGEREPGCWGGLVLLGQAPTGDRRPYASGIDPPNRGLYGGDAPADSSGVLRYVRVEFAGAGSYGAGVAFYGVGSGTAIDHLQSHASGGVGIRMAGGTSDCRYCVASGSVGHGIAWEGGWAGRLQHVYVQQPGGCGIEASTHGIGLAEGLASRPQIFGVTVAKSSKVRSDCEAGIMIRQGGAIIRNIVVHGLRDGAVRFADELSKARFTEAGGVISHVIAVSAGDAGQLAGPREHIFEQDPELVNVDWDNCSDPRPQRKAQALRMGSPALAPSDGWFDTNADYVGAFGHTNWLEAWTWLGPEPSAAP